MYSISLITKEMHPKTTKKYYHTPKKWWEKKKKHLTVSTPGEDDEQPEFSWLIVGMQNCTTASEDRLEVSYKS